MKSSNLEIHPDTRLAGRTEDGAGSSKAQRRARDLANLWLLPGLLSRVFSQQASQQFQRSQSAGMPLTVS
jgi:hypothetical protein